MLTALPGNGGCSCSRVFSTVVTTSALRSPISPSVPLVQPTANPGAASATVTTTRPIDLEREVMAESEVGGDGGGHGHCESRDADEEPRRHVARRFGQVEHRPEVLKWLAPVEPEEDGAGGQGGHDERPQEDETPAVRSHPPPTRERGERFSGRAA